MESFTIYSSEDLRTLDRGYTQEPIDMPESEIIGKQEYIVHRDEFLKAYQKWNRHNHAILRVPDQLSHQDIWLSQRMAEEVYRAIEGRQESIDLT